VKRLPPFGKGLSGVLIIRTVTVIVIFGFVVVLLSVIWVNSVTISFVLLCVVVVVLSVLSCLRVVRVWSPVAVVKTHIDKCLSIQ
jgi:hypothetical protein